MSPQTSAHQSEELNRLLNRLLECVQECQKRYGGKTELATEFDQCVSSLCSTLEVIFLHGLRNRPLENISALKQVSDIVTNSLHLNNDNPSFWAFLKKHLTKHEVDRYNVLKHIWTDTGRGRAWIRSTLNERSLERYSHILLSNQFVLRTFYEDWAFLCDEEKSSLLPNMAAGLASILFAVSIDKPELNSVLHTKKLEKQRPEPIIEAPFIVPVNKKDPRKRKVAKQLISFDDDNDSILSSSIPSSTSSVVSEGYTTHELPTKTYNHKETMDPEEAISSDSHSSGSSDNTQNIKQHVARKYSIENSGSREKYPTHLEGTLTSLENNIGELTPVSIETAAVGEVVETPSDVSAILTAVETKNQEEQAKMNEKLNLLSMENEGLKEQLKKYMDAVQMLKRDESGLNSAVNGMQINAPDYKSEAKLYEQKLVQVAEMHAELMDFNVVLQQTLCQKDSLVERLKSELEELRGPISEEELAEESRSCINVWIPSAFLTGTGSEAHHVYQIFLRAGNEEWNIYRRYAQFHALHSDLKKLDPVLSSFDFPPKKSLRNKDSSLVEDRRKRLQIYLRRVLSHWPELAQCNTRFLIEQHLTFFKDQKDPKTDTKRGIFNTRRSAGNTSNENHYTGL